MKTAEKITFEDAETFFNLAIEYFPHIRYMTTCHLVQSIQGVGLTLGEQLKLIKKLRQDSKLSSKAIDYLDRQIADLEKRVEAIS